MDGVLKKFCKTFILISAQEETGETPSEYAFQLMVRQSSRNAQMLSELEEIDGMQSISLTMQEQLLEV